MSRRLISTWTVLGALFLTVSLSVLQSHATPAKAREDFDAGFTLTQTVGAHADWYDGGAGPVVTDGSGVAGSVGLAPATNIFTWAAHPFGWSAAEFRGVILQMDFQSDSSAKFYDDRIGWMTTDGNIDPANFFGVQLDNSQGGGIVTWWQDGSGAPIHTPIAALTGIKANTWYRFQAVITKLTGTSARIDVSLVELDAGGNRTGTPITGTVSDSSTWPGGAPDAKYFTAATLWPAYKHFTATQESADNAFVATIERFAFVVTTDWHTSGAQPTVESNLQQVRSWMISPTPDMPAPAFMVVTGDFPNWYQTQTSIDTVLGSGFRWYPVIGNHEIDDGIANFNYVRDTMVPSLPYIVNYGPTGSANTSYSWDYSNAHFIAVNAYWDGTTNPNADHAVDGDIRPQLRTWIDTDLADSSAPRRFVFIHEPAYPDTRHVGDSLDKYSANRDAFIATLNSHEVETLFCGHTHYYEHDIAPEYPLGNLHQVTNGALQGTGATITYVLVDGDSVTYKVYYGGSSSPFEQWTIGGDSTAPTVTIDQAVGQVDPANASPINFTAVFSKSVTGFSSSGVIIGGTAGGTKSVVVTGGGTTYNVAVSGMTNGTITASVAASAAQDAAGNGNVASTSTDNSITYDSAVPTLTSISVSPASASVVTNSTQQFTATARDQFGNVLSPQPSVTWTVSGGGTIASSGLFTAGSTAGGPYTVTAASGGVNGTASVTVTAPPPTLTSISVSPASASVVTNSTQQFTATARDQFGNVLSPQPSVTWTVSGGGTIASSGLFTAGSTAGGPYTVTAASGGVNGTASVTVTAASTFIIGETNILSVNYNGIGNLLIAQQTTLGQTATILSMSLYVTTASGNLRLGIYDTTGPNGGPGQLKAQTAAFTPIPGWNTQNVVSQVSLPAGTYWLAYLPSSNSLGVRVALTGSIRYYSYSYQALPATFSTSPTSFTGHCSFYATFHMQTTPPTLTSISVSPASASVVTNSTQQFTATARDQFGNVLSPQPSVTWTVSGGGTIASSGLFTAGSTAGGPYTVTAASGGVNGTASVTVTAPPPTLTSISVSPASASVVTNSTQQFTATARDQFGNVLSPQPSVTWTVSGGGTIASSGLFTAGSTAGGPYTVTAASGGVNGTASVTVTAPPPTLTSISVSPASASVVTNSTQQFTATARDQFGNVLSPQPSVTWTVSGGGTIASSGLFTAGSTAGGPYTVTAASGGVNGTASVTVTAASTFIIGETNILSVNYNGIGNLLIAQQTTLGQTATILSMSLYVTTASGNLRLGIYDTTGPNGGPGQLKAQTAAFTPIPGWNTQNVVSQVSLPAGTYWLAYLPSSNSLGVRVALTGSIRYYSYSYQALPATFSTSPTSFTGHCSFYATFHMQTTPPTLTSISVSPASASVVTNSTQQFTATARDQFGNVLSPQPSVTWTVSGGGTIASSGLFTAGSTAGGPYTVTAASGGVNGTASVTVTASTIAVNDFANYRVFQRDIGGTSTSVTISGTYSDMSWNRVEGRVLQHGTSTAVVDWTTIDPTPGGGAFSGNLTVPQGGWYNVEVRALDAAGSVIGSSRGTNKWGVGMLILCIGQSNMVGKGHSPFTIATSDLAVNYSNAGRWEHLADPYDDESPAGAVDNDNSTAAGSMIPALANSLLQTFNFPIAFVPSAKDGSNLYSQWAYRNPSNHYDASTLYGQSITKAQSVGGVELIIMHQGEADTNAHRTEAQYEADFATMIGNYRQDLYATIPIFICQLGTISIEGGDPRTDADVVAVRSAQRDLDNGVNIFMAATAMDQPRMDDVHYTLPGFNAIGGRIGQAIKYYLGATSYYRGPEILSVFFADANRNTVDVEITHRGGNDITPVSGITGFSLLSNGLPVGITSADRMSADRIRLTLASAIPQGAATTLRYLWGSNPDTSALVKDNEPMALPLENTTADITVTDMPLP